MNDYKWKIDCDISPRELSYALSEFHRAPSGDGALGFTWQDKPHRIVYDLIAAVKYYAMRVDELESRLEISPLHNVDGIMARDATIKLQDEYIAKLESERAEREKQEPVLWTSKKAIDAVKKFGAGCIYLTSKPEDGNDASLYTTQPVTAPVRLTDSEAEAVARIHGTGGWQTLADMMRFSRAIETAVLRANGFKVEE